MGHKMLHRRLVSDFMVWILWAMSIHLVLFTSVAHVWLFESVMSDSLRCHELQHARLPCSPLAHRACSNSCPLSWWYHPAFHPLSSPSPPTFPSIRVFSNESVLCIRWSFSFSISPSNEYSGLISFVCVCVKSLQSCPTLCDPIDGSPPGSPIPGILQARTLE